MKSLEGTLDGRRVRIARLDTPFVPLDEARAAGHTLVLALTPASGAPGGLDGFTALPCGEAACRTVLPVPWPKEPEWLRSGDDPLHCVPGLRALRPGDLEEIAAIHAGMMAEQRLRIDRGRDAWEKTVATRDAPFWVIERDGGVEAYILLGAGRLTLRWREHGARRGAEGLLADLFWSVLAWARRTGLSRIEGWCMPEVLTVAPLYPTSDRARKGSVPLLRSLDPRTPLPVFKSEDECRVWEVDAS